MVDSEATRGLSESIAREFHPFGIPNYEAVCFHAQQCAEKYLKARLQDAGIQFGKTHDLPALLDMLPPVEPAWGATLSDLQTLSTYAVAYRYPGDSAGEADATDATNK